MYVNTIISATIIEQEAGMTYCYLQKTDSGLSLLGGAIDWRLGIPLGLNNRIQSELKVDLEYPSQLGSIAHHKIGDVAISNINLIYRINRKLQAKDLVRLNIRDILVKDPDEFRTRDTLPVLERAVLMGQPYSADTSTSKYLDRFIVNPMSSVQYDHKAATANSMSADPSQKAVVGVVVYDSQTKKYVLVRNNRVGSAVKGKLMLAGGKMEFGETIKQAGIRESGEELECTVNPRGIIGFFVNEYAPGLFACNSAVFATQKQQEITRFPSVHLRDEISERLWMTRAQLEKNIWQIGVKDVLPAIDLSKKFKNDLIPFDYEIFIPPK